MADSANLVADLYQEIQKIPCIDTHSHLNPHQPFSKTLDDILGNREFTELAHAVGMPLAVLSQETPVKDCMRDILTHLERLDNTVAYSWFLEIARAFLGFQGERLTAREADVLWTVADKAMNHPQWETHVWKKTNVAKVFLTNAFDDPLTGIDTQKFVPCLDAQELVFSFENASVRERLAKATGVEVSDTGLLHQALTTLFRHFTSRHARACVLSLPADFVPEAVTDDVLSRSLMDLARNKADGDARMLVSRGVLWRLAEHCRAFQTPFLLTLGGRPNTYERGVPGGGVVFDSRVSMIPYAALFNAFPEVAFPLAVPGGGLLQERVRFSCVFPNIFAHGFGSLSLHPGYGDAAISASLLGVPKTKQLGFFSEASKVEFLYPKIEMIRRSLAKTLAKVFVEPGIYSENRAVELARLLLHDNSQRIFRL